MFMRYVKYFNVMFLYDKKCSSFDFLDFPFMDVVFLVGVYINRGNGSLHTYFLIKKTYFTALENIPLMCNRNFYVFSLEKNDFFCKLTFLAQFLLF